MMRVIIGENIMPDEPIPNKPEVNAVDKSSTETVKDLKEMAAMSKEEAEKANGQNQDFDTNKSLYENFMTYGYRHIDKHWLATFDREGNGRDHYFIEEIRKMDENSENVITVITTTTGEHWATLGEKIIKNASAYNASRKAGDEPESDKLEEIYVLEKEEGGSLKVISEHNILDKLDLHFNLEDGEAKKPKSFTQEQIDEAHEEAERVLEEARTAYDKPSDEDDYERSFVYEKYNLNEAINDMGAFERGDEDEEMIEKYLEKAKERKEAEESSRG
jgi:hypothetical protein